MKTKFALTVSAMAMAIATPAIAQDADEAPLAAQEHLGGAVERSYRRTDFLEQRRALMERWALFLTVARKPSVDALSA